MEDANISSVKTHDTNEDFIESTFMQQYYVENYSIDIYTKLDN